MELPGRNEPIEVDEMHTSVGKKNYGWIWIAVDRYGKRFIAFVNDDRSTQTGLKLWNKIKDLKINAFTFDHWKSYEEFVLSKKYIQTKAETYTTEGCNSRIRLCSARFKRKGKCYSKAYYMIEISLNLFFMNLNNKLSIYHENK
jgi:insertion element IS1 protein InsB